MLRRMRSVAFLALVVLVSGCSPPAKPRARTVAPPAPVPVEPAAPEPPSALVLGEGTFVLELRGKPLGRERFSIRKIATGFEIETESRATFRGQAEIASKGFITTDAAWRALSASITMEQDGRQKMIEARTGEGGLLEATTSEKGQVTTSRTKQPIDLFITANTVAQFAALCALPPEASGTKVMWPDTTVAYEPAAPLAMPERSVLVRTFLVGDGAKVNLACENGLPVGMYQKASALLAVREGDGALAAALAPRARRR